MGLSSQLTREEKRLLEDKHQTKYWKRWGPYVSERQWGTVREDYSNDGNAWTSFTFDESKSRTYRWGEDGLAGVSDNHQFLCFTIALWNEKDDILKEKAFGLPNDPAVANHGEDVKEVYYYLDNTPTHSYMKYLYKYPINKFPYEDLVETNSKRTKTELEYEITDTKVFEDNNYFDVFFEMAKDEDDPDELYFRITAWNRSQAPAPLHIMPHVFFRNTWSWGSNEGEKPKPNLSKEFDDSDYSIKVDHWKFGDRRLIFAPAPGLTDESPDVEPKLLFTDNETNFKKLYKVENKSDYCKDAFHDHIVDEVEEAVNPENSGTKACAWFTFDENGGVPPGDYVTIRYKYTAANDSEIEIDEEAFDRVFDERQMDADEFYWNVSPLPIPADLRNVQRQAFAGLLWTKQYYSFIHEYWSKGDPNSDIKPAPDRANGRNQEWRHIYMDDILSNPDKWEYPFFAAWDLAFHCIPLVMIDPEFAKKQLDLLTREWYMHPNGQLPAYEWNFGDVNPPVHAWAVYRVYKAEKSMYGRDDREFLERVFQKLLLNFTWWVNRKDSNGNGVFEGGFLGLDNIGIFNRSEPLPTGGKLEQADSTGWMAFYSLTMLNIALELAKENHVYEDIASKFFEHYLLIADAMTYMNASTDNDGKPTDQSLWNEEDQFFYDAITWGGSFKKTLPVRSLVGLIPLYATLTLEPDILDRFPRFKKRLNWLVDNKSHLFSRNIASMKRGSGDRLLLSLVSEDRLRAVLQKMFDESEFLSKFGIRSLSKYHEKNPLKMNVNGEEYVVAYLPGESDSGLFGGNSNWRGPIWFPTNFLLIESLQRFYLYYGSDFKIEVPTGSGEFLNLAQAAEEIQHRLIHIFIPNDEGQRAYNVNTEICDNPDNFSEYVHFYEYFHGDTGRGLGASHQCGWTSLVAKFIHDVGVSCRPPQMTRSQSTMNMQKQEDSNGRRGSYFDNDYNFEDYVPKSSPNAFPSLSRRRSGKSLLNLTARLLHLDDEEQKATLMPGLSAVNTHVKSASVSTHQSDDYDNDDFLSQVKSAMSRFSMKDIGDHVSPEELETHN